VNELPETITSVHISPNPVKDLVQVNIVLRQAEQLSIRLLDAQGKVQQVFTDGQKMQAGRHQFSFSALNMPGGIYFLQIQSNHNSYTRKLVITS